jgi:hypothetical protein
MKALLALSICGLSIALSAQTGVRTFTSPDGTFRFRYSPLLIDCTKLVPSKPAPSNVPKVFLGTPPPFSVPDSCMSQAPMCTDPGVGATTIACYAYPKDEFRNKPAFTAATFFVAEIAELTKEKDCLQGSQYWNPGSIETAKVTKINGTIFKVFEVGGGWAGGGQWGLIYRTFHRNKCYELGIQNAAENPGGFDEGTFEEFTKKDNDKVEDRLNRVLNSFKFLR